MLVPTSWPAPLKQLAYTVVPEKLIAQQDSMKPPALAVRGETKTAKMEETKTPGFIFWFLGIDGLCFALLFDF
jgi:hypothetical protein